MYYQYALAQYKGSKGHGATSDVDVPCFDAVHLHPPCWDKVLDALLQLQHHLHCLTSCNHECIEEEDEGEGGYKGVGIKSREGMQGGVREDIGARKWSEGRSLRHILSVEINMAVATYLGSKVVAGSDDDKKSDGMGLLVVTFTVNA